MKERIKNSWIYKNNWIFLFIIIGIIGIIGTYERRYKKEHGLYTIGYVYRTDGAAKGVKFYFKYYYQGEEYKSSFIKAVESSELLNKRFYMQFLANNPKKCLFFSDKPVPSCIEKTPFDGWETIPTQCDE